MTAAKEKGTTEEDLAIHTAGMESLEYDPPEDVYEEEVPISPL